MDNIGFDLDNTLIPTGQSAIEKAEKFYYIFGNIKNEITEYDFNNLPIFLSRYLNDLFYNPKFLYNIVPDKKVISQLRKLREKYNIYIITARSPSDVIEVTERYIERYFPFVNNIIFNCEKYKIINAYNIKYFVEDNLDHVYDILKYTDCKIILMNYKYNNNMFNGYRIIKVKKEGTEGIFEAIKYLNGVR